MTASADKVQLSEEEINERVQILHKLREHLNEQRNRFYRYLDVLEHEEQDILSNDVEKLEYHVELEKDLAREIQSFQKVIDPLNEMYKVTVSGDDAEIPQLQESLDHIQEEVKERGRRNRQLLKERMENVRNEITSVKKPKKSRSVYDDYRNQPSMIDIIT